MDWLTETKTELQQLGPRMEAPEVVERIEKLKVDIEYNQHDQLLKHLSQLSPVMIKFAF